MTNKSEKPLDPLDNARELGNSITESKEYKQLVSAEDDFHNDTSLQKMIKELESLKTISSSCGNNHERLMYDDKINELKQNISKSDVMNKLNLAKAKYDKVFKNVNNIISYITDDESRVKVKEESSGGCGGGCSSCSCK